MWGVSALLFLSGFAAVFVVIALAAGWALPILGVGIVVLVAPRVVFAMTRESGEPGGEPPEEVGAEPGGGKPSWMRKHWWE